MNNRVERFLKSLNIENIEDFDLDFDKILKPYSDRNYFIYYLKKDSLWDYHLFEEFLNGINSITSYTCDIYFEYTCDFNFDSVINFVKEWLFSRTSKDINFEWNNVENKILFSFKNELDKQEFNKNIEDLRSLFQYLNYNYILEIQDVFIKENKNEEENHQSNLELLLGKNDDANDIKLEDVSNKLNSEFNKIKEDSEEELHKALEDNYMRMLEERLQKTRFKKGGYVPIDKLINIDGNNLSVDVNGKTFDVDEKLNTTQTGKKKIRFGISDGTSAIYCNAFEGGSLSLDTIKQIKNKINVRILGRLVLDSYNKEYQINVHEIDLLPDDKLREDHAETKRVELHLHTNMSEMDGITSITDYVKLAKNMGHKAIGLTDHAVVQSFPEAASASKKYGVKILYGCEVYMINDYLKGCFNPNNQSIKDSTYVVFDLESTGLSVKYDKITEFGAVKYKNGIEIDRLNILINPGIHISDFIAKKTHIDDELVKNEKKIDEVLPTIKEFIKDSVLISHNLEFDYYLLNQAFVDNGYKKLSQPGIDTLALSRFLFPRKRGHSLKELSKELEVEYDEESAHRATYDASVLGSCWHAIYEMLIKDKKILTLKELENLEIPNEYLNHIRRGAFHTTIFVKNRAGLKDLYNLVRMSHVETLGYYPFVKRSEIEKRRDNFLIGSACFNGEVFYNSYRRNKDKLIEAIKFYDFIEIQPLGNYSHLVFNGEIPNEEMLKKYILDIIEASKSLNKIIVATGDVHYAEKSDKKYRDVLIETPGVGKKWHPLAHSPFSKKEDDEGDSNSRSYFPNPDQHFRSTDDMLDCFKWLGDDGYQYVVTNTNLIADMIEEIQPIPPGLYPPKIKDSEKILKDLCYKRAHELYGENLPELIKDRLDKELEGIISNGYSVIYYISHLLVKESNDRGYIVGSRGSVGSSFAATMASITEVNPLAPHYRCPKCKHFEFANIPGITSGFDLPEKRCPNCGEIMISDGQSIPFQTFLGFNAEKTPDIDLNFPTDFQSQAHLILKDLLGEKNVFRAGTISTIKLKTAIGNITKNYLPRTGQSQSSYKAAEIKELAFGTTGVKRTTGQHPGGIVAVPNEYDVTDFTPTQFPADDSEATWQTTHFDYNALHDTLLKFDMLGHVDPQAVKMMSDLTGVDGRNVPMNDKKVLSIFSSDKELNLMHKYLKEDNGALGLPEFGTEFVRQMLRETNPQTFSDLLIISGLSHGTDVWAFNAQTLIKDGITNLKGVIGCRDDIMEYLISMGMDQSESFKIMEIVRKNKKLSDEQIQHMKEHGVPDYYIESCRKIAYLFPKGHACAYVMMAVRVAYYKVYYPLEYYATFFTLRCDAYDIKTMIGGIDAIYEKLKSLEQRRNIRAGEGALSNKEKSLIITLSSALEMHERGFKFLNVDINKSDSSNFIVDKESKALILPLKVLDGLGENSGDEFIKARNEKPFSSIEDFKKRSGLTSTVIGNLIDLHCLDHLKEDDNISLFDFSF